MSPAASATKDKGKEAATATAPASILDSMEKEETMPVAPRGRGLAPETVAVRDELLKCMEEGTIRSFHGVTSEKKEDFARIVRNAGNHVDFDISTRFDSASGKLFWGPKEVMDKLAKSGS